MEGVKRGKKGAEIGEGEREETCMSLISLLISTKLLLLSFAQTHNTGREQEEHLRLLGLKQQLLSYLLPLQLKISFLLSIYPP